jgi:multisubunit Na+/H+ antiporter MnhB subunit
VSTLRRRESLIWRACGVSFALLLITFLVFRADPSGVWAFLVDLARY